jgi:hypothetical protein
VGRGGEGEGRGSHEPLHHTRPRYSLLVAVEDPN